MQNNYTELAIELEKMSHVIDKLIEPEIKRGRKGQCKPEPNKLDCGSSCVCLCFVIIILIKCYN